MHPAAAVAFVVAFAVLAACQAPPTATLDSDGDGLPDAVELAGWNITVTLANGTVEHRHVSSDPHNPDTDGHGLSDLDKFYLHLDPHSADTDGDGLTDCQEVRESVKAYCEDPNWHGVTDGGTHTRADMADTDGDGLPDGMEVNGFLVHLANGTRLVHTNPLKIDTDGDGLSDGDEVNLYHTDPSNPDTNGNGCPDGEDPIPSVPHSYLPGLRTLDWNGTNATLHVEVKIADSLVPLGEEAGFAVHGGANDLSGFPAQPVQERQCSFTPRHPWVDIDLWVERKMGTRWVFEDVNSLNVTGLRVWWNVQTGRFSPNQDGSASFAGPIVWRGRDGGITFAPTVLFPQGSNPPSS
ncbi:MAG: binary toxin-like calcium binding domain-containing protein [Thermoplasmatota archaeon]